MTTTPMIWQKDAVPTEALSMLRTLGEEYPIRELSGQERASGGTMLRIEQAEGLVGYEARAVEGGAWIRYGLLADLGRALGALLMGTWPQDGGIRERRRFATLGVVIDCGHNGTVTSIHLRKLLRRLSLLGYNMVMIYTEGGYRLPGEPCFGYMRGVYTQDELKKLDDYTAGLGIEMVGCIQCLGHLEQVLKWSPYSDLRDTDHILMVGEPRTYELIGKMLEFWSGSFRSRRLHVGMDETYDLGRGAYLDRHGHRKGLAIYAEHLARVSQLCGQHGLRPMLWSDVLFKLAGPSASHYASDHQIPSEISSTLPRDLDLVYWDYYSADKAHYQERIRSHQRLGHVPVVASGVWSWGNFWHDWGTTVRNGDPCIDACAEAGVQEILFTMWSDDGAFWELDSSLAGLTYVAERCHGDGTVDESVLASRFHAICHSDLAVHRAAARMNEGLRACPVMWDDPLLAMYMRQAAQSQAGILREAETRYLAVAGAIAAHRGDRAAGDINHAWLVARTLAAKVGIESRLAPAYRAGDRAALQAVRDEIPSVLGLLEELSRSFRSLWLERCQPFGLEVLQIRFAGLAARYRELSDRLAEYLDGKHDAIPELLGNAVDAYLPSRSGGYRCYASSARVF